MPTWLCRHKRFPGHFNLIANDPYMTQWVSTWYSRHEPSVWSNMMYINNVDELYASWSSIKQHGWTVSLIKFRARARLVSTSCLQSTFQAQTRLIWSLLAIATCHARRQGWYQASLLTIDFPCLSKDDIKLARNRFSMPQQGWYQASLLTIDFPCL